MSANGGSDPTGWIWQTVLRLFGVAILLNLIVCLIRQIWVWLAVGIGIGLLITVIVAIIRWRHRY